MAVVLTMWAGVFPLLPKPAVAQESSDSVFVSPPDMTGSPDAADVSLAEVEVPDGPGPEPLGPAERVPSAGAPAAAEEPAPWADRPPEEPSAAYQAIVDGAEDPGAPAVPPEALAGVAAEHSAAPPPGDVPVEEFTPFSRLSRSEDGVVSVEVYAEPRFVEQPDGTWVEFEPEVVESALGSGWVAETAVPGGVVRFGDGAEAMLEVGDGDAAVQVAAEGLTVGEPVVAEGSVRYEDVATDTDLVYLPFAGGVKESVVLGSAAAPGSFTFRVWDPDAELTVVELASGGLGFDDAESGERRFDLAAPYAYEARAPAPAGTPPAGPSPELPGVGPLPDPVGGTPPAGEGAPAAAIDSTSASLTFAEHPDGGWSVTATIDETWRATAQYPVVLDPTYVFSGGTLTQGPGPVVAGHAYDDASCVAPGGCPFIPAGVGAGLPVGADVAGRLHVAYQRWRLWSDDHTSAHRLVPPRAQVDAGGLGLVSQFCHSPLPPAGVCGNTAGIQVHAVTGPWDPATARFEDLEALRSPTPDGSTPLWLTNGYNTVLFPALIQSWVDNPAGNHGLSIRSSAQPVPTGPHGGGFTSSTGVFPPILGLEYRYRPAGPPIDIQTTATAADEVLVDFGEATTGTWARWYTVDLYDTAALAAWDPDDDTQTPPTPVDTATVDLDAGDNTQVEFTGVPDGRYTAVVTSMTEGPAPGNTASAAGGPVDVGNPGDVTVEVVPVADPDAEEKLLYQGDGARVTVTVNNPSANATTADVAVWVPSRLRAVPEFIFDGTTRCPQVTGAVCRYTPADGLVEILDVPVPAASGTTPGSRQITFLLQAVTYELGCVLDTVAAFVHVAGFAPLETPTEVETCGNGLGVEDWWSYTDRPLGPEAVARVNAANGNLVVQQLNSTPVQGHGRLGYVLRSTYNSQTPPLSALGLGTIGAGWNLNVSTAGETPGLVTPTGLSVPSLGATLPTLTTPLSTVLVDRDGTRHLFTPNQVSLSLGPLTLAAGGVLDAHRLRGLEVAAGAALGQPGSNVNLCVDATYDSPPGVFLDLWRYVAVQNPTGTGCASAQGAAGVIALGYATMRPDRVRQVFSITGQLISQFDPAGNELRYRYALDLPTPVDDSLDDELTAAGLDVALPDIPEALSGLTLGPLRYVYEPGTQARSGGVVEDCDDDLLGDGPGASSCRGFWFDWDFDLTDPLDPLGGVTVTDPARRRIDYSTGGTLLTPVLGGVTVTSEDGTELEAWSYGYGDCGGNDIQLCGVTAPFTEDPTPPGEAETVAELTTSFDYDTDQGVLDDPVGPVVSLTERPVTGPSNPTLFFYSAGSTNVRRGVRVDRHRRIDEFGRVGRLGQGDQSTDRRLTDTTWDRPPSAPGAGDGISCVPRAGDDPAPADDPMVDVDHHRCAVVSGALAQPASGPAASNGTLGWSPSPNRVTFFAYNPQGQLLRTAQRLADGTDLVTTQGYAVQYHNPDGSIDTQRDQIAGGGAVTVGRRHEGHLFAVSDLVESLTPRGNRASDWPRYRTAIAVDNNTAPPPANTGRPNRPLGVGVCADPAAPTSNTGLVCRTQGAETTAGPNGERTIRPTTTFTYDRYGQRLTERSPQANDEGGDAIDYVYYPDDAADLTGTVSAGGWLARVHDTTNAPGGGGPQGAFVAFGYDRAGNVVRTWDRNATTDDDTADFPGSIDTPVPAYTETRYGPGPAAAAFAAPWRWPTRESNQLRDTTVYVLDARGNPTTIRPPRGVEAGGFDFDVVQVFDARDRLVSTRLPENSTSELWSYTYDEAGNLTSATDPNGHVTAQDYDEVNRHIGTRFTRGPIGEMRARGCAENDDGRPPGGVALPAGRIVCTATITYDGLDQPIVQSDPAGAQVWAGFDAAGRVVRRYQQRTTAKFVVAQLVYDADGNVVRACAPRQAGEDNGCPEAGLYATATTFDPAGRATETRSYRSAGQALVTRSRYDADGNLIARIDPRATATGADPALFTRRWDYDTEGRLVAESVPRSTTQPLVTGYAYDAAGNVVSIDHPDDSFTSSTYDAAHRPRDVVTAATSATAAGDGLLASDPNPANGGGSAEVTNARTRTIYDADGNPVARYGPRAFQVDVGDPNEAFMVRTDWDRNGRPIAQWRPYWDNRTANPYRTLHGQGNEFEECPPAPTSAVSHPEVIPGRASINYPAQVGVCATRVSYDPAGNLATIRTGGAASFRDGFVPSGDPDNGDDPDNTGWYRFPTQYREHRYTDDNLLWTTRGPNPESAASDGTTTHIRLAEMDYDGVGRLTRTLDPVGWVTVTGYTGDGLASFQLGQPAADAGAYSAHSQVRAFNYDDDGNRTVTNVLTAPDAWQSPGLIDSRDPSVYDTTLTSWTPDGLRALNVVDADGAAADLTTQYGYDLAGNPTTVIDPRGTPERHTYTPDNLLASTDTRIRAVTGGFRTRRTTYGYDPMGRKSSQATLECTMADLAGAGCLPLSSTAASTQTFAYNLDGSVRTETGRIAGQTITHRYQPDGARYSTQDSTSGVTVTAHTYLNGWTRTVASTASGPGAPAGYVDTQIDYAYYGDGAERARYVRDENNPIIEAAGDIEETEPTAVNDARLPHQYYVYDYLADTPAPDDGRVYGWFSGYDAAGRQITETQFECTPPDPPPPNPDGGCPVANNVPRAYATWARNPDGTVADKTVADDTGQPQGTGSDIAAWAYTYDPADRQTFQRRQQTGQADDTFAYRYDSVGRLDQVTNNGAARNVGYDNNGNRRTYRGLTWTYNLDDTIATVSGPGGTQTHTYDPVGRTTSDGCRTLAYDGFDRLTTSAFTGGPGCGTTGTTITYRRDGLNREIWRTEAAETTQITHIGATPTVQAETNPTDPTDGVRYFTDTRGRTVGSLNLDNDDFQYLHDDGHGNISLATSDQPAAPGDTIVECAVRYDPWGNTTPTAPATLADGPEGTPCENEDGEPAATPAEGQTETDVLYRDTRRDPTTGTYQWGNRTYNPDDATWLTPDTTRAENQIDDLSIATDPLTNNRYAYVNGDPINLVDLTGHEPCPESGCRAEDFSGHRGRGWWSPPHERARDKAWSHRAPPGGESPTGYDAEGTPVYTYVEESDGGVYIDLERSRDAGLDPRCRFPDDTIGDCGGFSPAYGGDLTDRRPPDGDWREQAGRLATVYGGGLLELHKPESCLNAVGDGPNWANGAGCVVEAFFIGRLIRAGKAALGNVGRGPSTAPNTLGAADDVLRLTPEQSWGNPNSLARHFRDHGADFGAASADDYARQASEFLQRSQAQRLPTRIDADGVIRVYDPATNTFGAFNPNGTTRTFFRPTSPTYWDRQPGASPWTG